MPKPKTPPETLDDTTSDEVDVVEIPFRGAIFVIPRDRDDWPTEACLALSEDNYIMGAKILLGSGQWAQLQSLGSKRRDVIEFLSVFGPIATKECVG